MKTNTTTRQGKSVRRSFILILLITATSITACQKNENEVRRVSQSLGNNRPTTEAEQTPSPRRVETIDLSADTTESDIIAYVDNQPISRKRIVGLLLAAHGVGVLEQVVVLDRARQMAQEQEITVTDNDVRREYDTGLRNLLSSMETPAGSSDFDRQEAEKILDEILSRKNISKNEYQLSVTRNAYLRAIVKANLKFTKEQLQAEFQQSSGPLVSIRHIQLANLFEAQRISDLLDAGADFETLAKNYSANLRTGPSGGLLKPFTQGDQEIPAAIRSAAFELHQGEVSGPVRADDWYHIIKVEKIVDQEKRSFDQAKPEIEKSLRRKLTEPAMQTLYQTLLKQADLRIIDPVLATEFQRKHPESTIKR